MDLLGEIIEHEAGAPSEPLLTEHMAATGFPELKKFDLKKPVSRFKAGKAQASSQKKKESTLPPKSNRDSNKTLSEAEKIHKENLERIADLTEEEISREREELLQALDPKLVQSLLRRTEERISEHNHEHAEGYSGWIGGGRNGTTLPHLEDSDVDKALGVKSVKFDTNDEVRSYSVDESCEHSEAGDDSQGSGDEIAPEGYQIVAEETDQSDVHFLRPRFTNDDPEMDINDPDFFDKLHEKYYPDLPKETNKLAWMKAPMPAHKISSYDAISDMRFDFKGNLVRLDDKSQDIPTYLGLHHHSDNPQLAGYTLAELVHLSRSLVPTQRCLGIQVLGRILHKLGLHKYNIVPIADDGSNADGGVIAQESSHILAQFEDMMWDLIDSLRVIESLTQASDESQTRNLSVRSYAVEALWLWKQGGGRPERKELDLITESLQSM